MEQGEAREEQLEVRRSARWFERGDRHAREVWFVLHGYGQLAAAFLDDCAPLAREGRLLVAPEALSRFYLRSGRGAIGASWMTREARAAEIADYVSYLDAALALVRSRGALASWSVLGFSQGVATAWRWTMASTHPPPRRLVACGGGVPPELEPGGERLRGVEVVLSAGASDGAYSPDAARAEREGLIARGLRCTLAEHAGGHELDRALLAVL